MNWSSSHIPDQTDRTAVVTGANSGIGFETARALAGKGAHVVLACRSATRGARALERILDETPAASAELLELDLSSLDSVRACAAELEARRDRLDLLINNAGVMMPPERSRTADGYELQLGTNHLGHFALTGLLLGRLLRTEGSRVVTVSSAAHRQGEIDFDDLQWERRPYRRMASYGQSKLANLLFTFELQRRLEAAGASTAALAAHPGWTGTNLQRDAPLFRAFNPLFAMRPWQGALPTLRAATAPDARGGEYYGPGGWLEMRGYPRRVGTAEQARSTEDAARLWQVSEELTGVRFELTTALRLPGSNRKSAPLSEA
ncbi:MAG: oxidoreductase [Acidobacteriota bacterium]|nr:oxidoreductase [Acidobacteriota bacterium]